MGKVSQTLGVVARTTVRRSVGTARAALVLACAGALIMAGRTLPL